MAEPYQMNTVKRGQRNTFKQGIPAQEHYGVNPFETGVTSQKGVPVDDDRGEFGVPAPGSNYPRSRDLPPTPHCTAITKEGNPCKAYPVTGEPLCIGHQRGSGQHTS